MKRSAIQPSSKPMKRSPMPPRHVPLASGGKLQTGDKPAPSRASKGKGLKTRQRAVSAQEKLYWNRLATEIGCICCMLDGHYNPVVSIHHIDGRTKPGCHQCVLPLCAGHHQQGTGPDPTLIAVHPTKARFVARYGTELELKARCDFLLGMTAA